MRIFLLALSGVLLLAGPARAADTTSTLHVAGWHCEGCGDRTASAVRKMKGVKDASADLDAKTLTVRFDDSEAKQEDIEKTVTSLHYKIVR